jgi:hypothetical protein
MPAFMVYAASGYCVPIEGCSHPMSCPGRSGRLSALSVSLCKSVFYGAFVWARRALNSQNRRFPARAVFADEIWHCTSVPFHILPEGEIKFANLRTANLATDELILAWGGSHTAVGAC